MHGCHTREISDGGDTGRHSDSYVGVEVTPGLNPGARASRPLRADIRAGYPRSQGDRLASWIVGCVESAPASSGQREADVEGAGVALRDVAILHWGQGEQEHVARGCCCSAGGTAWCPGSRRRLLRTARLWPSSSAHAPLE